MTISKAGITFPHTPQFPVAPNNLEVVCCEECGVVWFDVL